MDNLVPPIGTKGLYTLNTPFDAQVVAGAQYTTEAIRTFEELERAGIDIFQEFYDPLGLEESDVEADRTAGAILVSLLSDTAAQINVPSTYIVSYPDLAFIPYSHVVLGISLGPLPDRLDLSVLQTEIEDLVSEKIGITDATVTVGKGPSTGVITPANHQSIEAARIAGIASPKTTLSRNRELEAQLADLMVRHTALQQLMIDAGVIT